MNQIAKLLGDVMSAMLILMVSRDRLRTVCATIPNTKGMRQNFTKLNRSKLNRPKAIKDVNKQKLELKFVMVRKVENRKIEFQNKKRDKKMV